jgi:hypothetical protein
MHSSHRKPACLVGLLIIGFVLFALPDQAKALTVVNETERLVVCTVRSEMAIRPVAQFFVYPGKAYDWMPYSSQGQAWRVSVVAEDNGMYSNNHPVVVHPAAISNTLYVHPGTDQAELDVLESSAPTAKALSEKDQQDS